jgi:UDP-N-acetylglucosamine--N-acetylmuramyl-(pentapeptide) pyrophosphoryl-undecaprenol N-acetylglucosamine transferase
VIHEQNSIAGLANRVLAGVADRILVAFPGALPRSRLVGNPVRDAIASVSPPAARYAGRSGPLRVLVVGGSLGAAALNELVPKALALLPADARPRVTHQSGARHLDALRAHYAAAGVAGTLVAFIDEMAEAYADADVVLCRAGATTVAELAAAGVPAILVPFPFAVDDHQTTNARYLAEQGAAVLVQQRSLTPEKLADLLRGFTRPALAAMAEKARALGRPDAARAVAEACIELAK